MSSHTPITESTRRVVGVALAVLGAVACEGMKVDGATLEEQDVSGFSAPIVYERDDRQEWFAASDARARQLAEQSVVALLPRSSIEVTGNGARLSAAAPTLTQRGVCANERFATQPSPAFCSGVLLDHDLVLTAGHCAHAVPLEDMVVVFGYYYREHGELALTEEDVIDVSEVVDEAFGDFTPDRTFDYAWLRLAHDAPDGRRPGRWHDRDFTAQPGAALHVIASASGTPIKIDEGAHLVDPRNDAADFFIASSDTTGGSSGGPAFTQDGAVLGVLARGGEDYVVSASGCRIDAVVGDPALAEEEFTYAASAVERLCKQGRVNTGLCRNRVETPPATAPSRAVHGGCSVAALAPCHVGGAAWWWFGVSAAGARIARRLRNGLPSQR